MHAGVRSVHATTLTREMCAVRRIVSSPPAQNHGQREQHMGCSMLCEAWNVAVLSCACSETSLKNKSLLIRISALSNESSTMTAIDHHSKTLVMLEAVTLAASTSQATVERLARAWAKLLHATHLPTAIWIPTSTSVSPASLSSLGGRLV